MKVSTKKTEITEVSEGNEEKLGKVINIALLPEQRARMKRLIARMRQKDIPVQGIRAKIAIRGIWLALVYYERLLDKIPDAEVISDENA